MLSAAVPIRHDRLEPSTIVGGNLELDPCAHAGIVAEPDVQRDSYDCISALADGGQLSSYLPIADVLRSGLLRILDIRPVEYRRGARDELRATGGTGRSLRSGYFAYVNSPPDALDPARAFSL